MIKRIIAGLLLTGMLGSFLFLKTVKALEPDEGGIGGTGHSGDFERPDSVDRPDSIERIEHFERSDMGDSASDIIGGSAPAPGGGGTGGGGMGGGEPPVE